MGGACLFQAQALRLFGSAARRPQGKRERQPVGAEAQSEESLCCSAAGPSQVGGADGPHSAARESDLLPQREDESQLRLCSVGPGNHQAVRLNQELCIE